MSEVTTVVNDVKAEAAKVEEHAIVAEVHKIEGEVEAKAVVYEGSIAAEIEEKVKASIAKTT